MGEHGCYGTSGHRYDILLVMRWVLTCVLFLSLAISATAWLEPLGVDRGSMGLLQQLRKLQTRARVLYVVAHPDDEDGATIAKLSRGMGAEVVLLSLTRGESGANLVTDDAFDRLGLLRTVELRRGAQWYGARLRFTRAVDYGYSKNIEECWRQWNEDEVIRDVVRIIREEQPHVVISRWHGSARDGHGNHTAAGIVSPLAYRAAADPHRYPEQIAAGLPAWRALKHYANNYSETDAWTHKSETGIYDPVLGMTYAQAGREGLRQQRSQSAGAAILGPGEFATYYLRTDPPAAEGEKERSFFANLDLSLKPYPELERPLTAALSRFDPQNPQEIAPLLAEALGVVRRLRGGSDNRDLQVKETQIAEALRLALGLEVEARVLPENPPTGRMAAYMAAPTFQVATPGQSFEVTISSRPMLSSEVRVRDMALEAPAGWRVEDLGGGKFRVKAPEALESTAAFWKRDSVKQTFYQYTNEKLFGEALPPAPLQARVTYEYRGETASVRTPVLVRFMDERGLEHRRALAAGPALSIETETESGIFPLGGGKYRLNLRLRHIGSEPIAGTARLEIPAGWHCEPASAPFQMEKEGEATGAAFELTPPAGLRAGRLKVQAVAEANGREYRNSFRAITQPGFEVIYDERPAVHEVALVDVKMAPDQRIGYVMGAGDLVPAGLEQLGARVEMLDAAALAAADLSRYDSIWLGIRAYATRKDLLTYNARLLDYVKQGGVLVVQYNTPEFDHNYGPYPYEMTSRPEEVSEEDSPVQILAPEAAVFRWPNAITLDDFTGWVEQRGSKHLVSWAPEYQPMVEMHDHGQAPQRGIWLQARYGKGLYIYCSLAWYRQLPFAVPGAARIVANLASLGAKDSPWR
ncbi:MAG: PIG-L family deacetylase [Bryobacterales bacterium]|nr:PIG-L family deacetylase [Bryobacterales bacterium]